jgi:hypothetical protein
MSTFLGRAVDADSRRAVLERERAEIERRIEARFRRIEALLIENTRLLRALPDAVCEKLGLNAPGS